ncbi:MAG TPA: SH3 domain-containing protein, partial [Chromatiales bacterium]|nr:SH3 domain-containing protein [Chromatiales bacterium]
MLLVMLQLAGCETMQAMKEQAKEVLAQIGHSTEKESVVEQQQPKVPHPEQKAEDPPIEVEAPPPLKKAPAMPPPLEVLDADYTASKRSNVRAGPGMDYEVVNQLRRDKRVRVL